MIRVHGTLVELDDLPRVVDQQGCWQAEVAMAVKQVTVENVVNSGHVIRSAKDGK